MDRQEQAEQAMSALMRFGTSLILPAWALAMLILGIEYGSPWWIACGVVVGAIGVLFFVGNPLARPVLDVRERWRPVVPPKAAADKDSAENTHH